MIYKTLQMQRVEERFGEPIEMLLRRLYIDQQMGLRDIAKMLGCSFSTVSEYLRRCGIVTRLGSPRSRASNE